LSPNAAFELLATLIDLIVEAEVANRSQVDEADLQFLLSRRRGGKHA
jgi:hypothetical protein